MKVRFASSARASIRYRHAWWVANRDKAPGLFIEELRDAVSKLRRDVDAARQHYVYYARDEQAQVANVVLVDSAIAEHGPDL